MWSFKNGHQGNDQLVFHKGVFHGFSIVVVRGAGRKLELIACYGGHEDISDCIILGVPTELVK